jgi:cellulose biosynthesis protein BcsQ
MKREAATQKEDGHVVTFYSYKGGTGRSMALSNVAVLLAQSGKKVLMIDWDLEAPGLPKYFKSHLPKGFNDLHGLIDFFEMADKSLPKIPFDSDAESQLGAFFKNTSTFVQPLKVPHTGSNLSLMKAGRDKQEGYADQVGEFDWFQFFKKIPSFFTKWAQYLAEQYDYVLIDSRTGHTDTGGICTMQMPDKLVLVFTPNHQSFEGTSNLARKAVNARRRSHDLRPLMVYFLPSRIELNEDSLRAKWLSNYQEEITDLFEDLYDLPDISMENYVKQIQVRHASSYAYEEKLAVLEEKVSDTNSLSKVYRDFVGFLTDEAPVWIFRTNGKEKQPLKTFLCYAHEDREVVEGLRKQLAIFEKRGLLQIWWDGEILPGEHWDNAIKAELRQADLILLFISVDFMNSDYIERAELQTAFQRHRNDQATLIPIIVRPCDWEDYFSVGQFQPLPAKARPILSSHFPHRDEAFFEVAAGVKKAAEGIRDRMIATAQHKISVNQREDEAAKRLYSAERGWGYLK